MKEKPAGIPHPKPMQAATLEHFVIFQQELVLCTKHYLSHLLAYPGMPATSTIHRHVWSQPLQFTKGSEHAHQSSPEKGKYEHIITALSELHWLPVRQHIYFKMAMLTFKVRQSGHPTYISQQISDYTPNRSLCSASQHRLQMQPTRTVLAQCSFTSAAPKIWNSLPEDLQNYCTLGNFQTQT